MFRKLLIATLTFASLMPASAQNTSREFAEMKLNKEYLCEESTTQDPRQALENADLLLINRVNEYLAQNHPGVALSPAVLAGIKHLTMPRGDHTRVLSYISIAELTGAPAPAPATEAAPAPEAAPAGWSVGFSELQRAASTDTPKWQLEVIQELLKAKDISEASSLLSFFQQIKKIKTFGLVTDCADRAAVYWIIGNTAGGIKALLSPGEERHNFADGSEATLASFSGNPAVWFTF